MTDPVTREQLAEWKADAERRFTDTTGILDPVVYDASVMLSLISALKSAWSNLDEARGLLDVFADMGREMMRRGWKPASVAVALDNPGDLHRVSAGDFFLADAFLSKLSQQQPKGGDPHNSADTNGHDIGQNQRSDNTIPRPETQPVGGEPVAWRVKDFADGWILCSSRNDADFASREHSGALIQPLFTSQPSALPASGYGELNDTEVARARNGRVAARYDVLMHEGKHGHYETMFRVVREEVERVKRFYDGERRSDNEYIERLTAHLAQAEADLSALREATASAYEAAAKIADKEWDKARGSDELDTGYRIACANLAEKIRERALIRPLPSRSTERTEGRGSVKRIPIKAAKLIADEYGYDQVIIVARAVNEGEHVTTYGKDKANCDVAARIGNFLKYKIMGWATDNSEPSALADTKQEAK